jgi:hypothetical protein
VLDISYRALIYKIHEAGLSQKNSRKRTHRISQSSSMTE